MAETTAWANDACPDCNAKELVEASYDSDQVEDGTTIYCRGCGFEIAGKDAVIVRAAMGVLTRWGAVRRG